MRAKKYRKCTRLIKQYDVYVILSVATLSVITAHGTTKPIREHLRKLSNASSYLAMLHSIFWNSFLVNFCKHMVV